MPLGPPAEVPVELGREAAQELAREELARQIYRDAGPGLVQRLLGWLLDLLGRLLSEVGGVSPGGWAGVAVLVVLLVAAAVAIRLKAGPLGRSAARDATLFAGMEFSARDHRERADRHAASGEWAEAVRDRLRAVVRTLEERGLLEPRPGRTADEAAADGGLTLPGCAAGLRAAARVFDDVWYGGRTATAEHDAQLRELDAAVRSAVVATARGPVRVSSR